jgi:hypothetical protein
MDVGMARLVAGEPGGLELLVPADDHRRQTKLDGKPEEVQHFVRLRHLSEGALVLGKHTFARGGPLTRARH